VSRTEHNTLDDIRYGPRREDGKVFVPGCGWVEPGVCTPSRCAEHTGGKCAAYGCRKEKRRKRKDRKK
jgi:hypothetical protein